MVWRTCRMTSFGKGVRLLGWVSVLLLTTLGVYLYGGESSGDDTFIYMRYVQNFIETGRFVYNFNEPSYGVTSAFWAFLMVPVSWLGGNSLYVWKVWGSLLVGIAAGLLLIIMQLKKIYGILALLLMSLILTEPHNLRWYSSGMENSLVLLALVGMWLLWELSQHTQSSPGKQAALLANFGMLNACLAFIRPELGILAGLIAGVSLLTIPSSRMKLFFGLGYVVTLLGAVAITWHTFGALLPQTAEAKALFLKHADPWYGLFKTIQLMVSGSGGAMALILCTWKTQTKQTKVVIVILTIYLLALIAYFTWINQIISSRYASYFNLPIVLVAAMCLAQQHTQAR